MEVGEGEAGFLLSREPQAGLDPKTLASVPQQKAATQVPHSMTKFVFHDSIRWMKQHSLGSASSGFTLTHCVFLCSFGITEDFRNLLMCFLADGFLLGIFLCKDFICFDVTYLSFLIPRYPT